METLYVMFMLIAFTVVAIASLSFAIYTITHINFTMICIFFVFFIYYMIARLIVKSGKFSHWY